MANLSNQTETKKPLIIEGVFPISALPFLEKMGLNFKRSGTQSSLSDYVFLEVEINDISTLLKILLAGDDAGYERGKQNQLSIQCQALNKALLNLKTLAA
jgi:hypothetical protein